MEDDIRKFSRELRRNQTESEKIIWRILRDRQFYGLKFRRQHIIDNYILDFYCHQINLAIEIDGGQHYQDRAIDYDAQRTIHLQSKGITLIRFTNFDVLNNLEGVMSELFALIKVITPDLSRRERG